MDILGREAEAGKNRRRTAGGCFRADIARAQLDIRDAHGSVALSASFSSARRSVSAARLGRASSVRPARRFLRDMAEIRLARHGDGAAFKRDLAKDQLEQGGFPAAIAADQPRARRRGKLRGLRCPAEPVAEAIGEAGEAKASRRYSEWPAACHARNDALCRRSPSHLSLEALRATMRRPSIFHPTAREPWPRSVPFPSSSRTRPSAT